jgi:hypothetical protein
VTDSVADRLRGLLASDVYPAKGRLRADDLGLDELMQFDWTLVGEADELAALLAAAPDLAVLDQAAVQQRLRRVTEVMADRRRYAEVS